MRDADQLRTIEQQELDPLREMFGQLLPRA